MLRPSFARPGPRKGNVFNVCLCAQLAVAVWTAGAGAVEVPFETPLGIEADSAISVAAADIDGDREIDLVGITDDVLYWYERSGGGSFTRHFIIEGSKETDILIVTPGDTDGDGDIDLLVDVVSKACNPFGCFPLPLAVLFENVQGDGSAWEEDTSVLFSPIYTFADVNGDGAEDVVTVSDSDAAELVWVDVGTGTITTIAEGEMDAFLGPFAAGDLDDDCDVDVLVAPIDGGIDWYENTAGDGSAWQPHVLTALAVDALILATADFDGDGRTDVLTGSADLSEIRVYRNLGHGTFSDAILLDASATGLVDLSVADVDGDTDLDVVALLFEGGLLAWYENVQGNGRTWTRRVPFDAITGGFSITTGDLNNDRRTDVVLASTDLGIAWYDNRLIRRSARFPEQTEITSAADGAESLAMTDLDGDGDLDLLSASAEDDSVRWYENSGTASPAFTGRLISTQASGAASVGVGDLDADGDPDVVAAAPDIDDIIWYENDGTPSIGTWTAHLIAIGASGVRSLAVGDVDCDGDQDVVSADFDAGRVRLWRSNGKVPPGWSVITISSPGGGPTAVAFADIDSDGDLDVLSAWLSDDAIRWHRNTIGTGTIWTQFGSASNCL